MAVQGHDVGILTGAVPEEPESCVDRNVRLEVVASPFFRRCFHNIGYITRLHTALKGRNYDVIHSHSLWLLSGHYASIAAHRFNVPHVISTHGCLEPFALSYRSVKKKIALRLYQQRDFGRASAFHATALKEAEHLRKFGIRKPIAIVPIGVQLPPVEPTCSFSRSKERKTALIVSRIHPIKGILKLLEAWADLNPPSWQLLIAGNDDQGHLNQVMVKIRTLGLEDRVRYLGPVYGNDKDKLYRTAELFILPSYSENFGIVVAEALSYGVPVIATNGTPWIDLKDFGCGWYIGTDIKSLADALKDAFSMPTHVLRDKGLKGRALIEKKYQWPAIARDMNAFYLWLRFRGSKPDFVLF